MVLRNWNYFSPIEERGDMKGRKPKDGAMRLPSGNAGRRAIKESSGSDLFMREPVVKPGGLNELESQEWDRLTSTPAPILFNASAGLLRVVVQAFNQMMEADAIIRSCRKTGALSHGGQALRKPEFHSGAHSALRSLE